MPAAGHGWNSAGRLACLVILALGAVLPGLAMAHAALTGPGGSAGFAAFGLAFSLLGVWTAWQSLLRLRISWFLLGLVLLSALLGAGFAAEDFDLDRVPDQEEAPLRVMPWVAGVLLGAAMLGFWLAWRARQADTGG